MRDDEPNCASEHAMVDTVTILVVLLLLYFLFFRRV